MLMLMLILIHQIIFMCMLISITGDDDPDAIGVPDKNNISAVALIPKKKVALIGSDQTTTAKGTSAYNKPAKNNAFGFTRAFRSFTNTGKKPSKMANPNDKKEAPTKGANLAGAVAFVDSVNEASASIADNATIIVNGGDVAVNSYVEDNIKVNVTAHVKKPAEFVSGAIAFFYGSYVNNADAFIGDSSEVTATGDVRVTSLAKIPNQIIVDDEFEDFLDTGEKFIMDWSLPEVDTPAATTGTGVLAPVTNAISGLGGQATGYIQRVNALLAEKTAAETALLAYFPSFLTTAGFCAA